jgi:phosphatidylglycerophosphate synthase
MKPSEKTASDRIRNSRKRLNLLKVLEFKTIEYLCKVMPQWVSPNILTGVGLLGSIIVAIGLLLGIYNSWWLVLSVAGFAIQWFGDSLDGRLAYFRNIPRKWYGWSLDLNIDWISTSIIGLGFYFYFPEYKIVSFLFVVAYAGSMIVALMRYKINNQYIIDAGIVGPTELRIIICFFLVLEIIFPGALLIFALFGSIILMIINMVDSYKVMMLGDERDIQEKFEKSALGAA